MAYTEALLSIFDTPELCLLDIDAALNWANFHELAAQEDHALHLGQRRARLSVPLQALLDLRTLRRQNQRATPEPASFIFMTDYCCSTLLINMLACFKRCFALSEPSCLASLALTKRSLDFGYMAPSLYPRWRAALSLALDLLSRPRERSDVVVVKEWPVTNYIAGEIADIIPTSRALFLYSDLRSYLMSVLKSRSRVNLVRTRITRLFPEVKQLTGGRLPKLEQLEPAEMAALHWVLQVHLVSGVAAPRWGSRMRSLDCVRLLTAPEATLLAVADHIGLSPTPEQARRIVDSSVFSTYSKSTGPYANREPFGQEKRAAAFESLLARYSREVEQGVRWAEQFMDLGLDPEALSLPA